MEGVIEMTKEQKYEEFKRHLWSLNLDWQEYERRLREWCIKNNF